MPLTTIVQGMLADNSVISTTISAENVKDFDIALSAIRTRHIKDYEIQTYHLSSNIIDSRVIASSAITTRHYAASSIQNIHLSAGCIRTANIVVSAVTVDKLNLDVFQNFRGSKVYYNDSSSFVISNSNYLSVHGAVIIHRYYNGSNPNQIATIQLEDSADPIPSNFHCWILNQALAHVEVVGSAIKPLRYDARKFTNTDNNTNKILLSGYYTSGASRLNAYPFVYAFVGNEKVGASINPVIYVTSYNSGL